jgi:hypothetical protein
VSTGGQTSKRSPFPVGLTVLNVNAEVQDAAGHICFVPVLDVHDLSTVDRTKANFLLRQGCINAVISRIEAVAAVGFTCRLPGFVQERRFRPFLCAMQLDSKETYAYAGLRSERCCPWCRLRQPDPHRHGLSGVGKCHPCQNWWTPYSSHEALDAASGRRTQ